MTIRIVGLLDNKEQAKEVKFIAKLVLVGNRARELAIGGQNGRIWNICRIRWRGRYRNRL